MKSIDNPKENRNISSVLFCCNYNSVRSPMAEGIFKKLIGRKIFVQSAGVFDTLEIDGFTVKVCNEINVKLSKHRVRSLREMEREGGFIGSFDLIIPFTRESYEEAYKYSTYSSVIIENWIVDEPIKYISSKKTIPASNIQNYLYFKRCRPKRSYRKFKNYFEKFRCKF